MHRQDWIPGSFCPGYSGPGVSFLPVHSTPALQFLPGAPVNYSPQFSHYTYPSYNPLGVVTTQAPVQNYYTVTPFVVNTTQYVHTHAIHPRVLEPPINQIRLAPNSSQATVSRSESLSRPNQLSAQKQRTVMSHEQVSREQQAQSPQPDLTPQSEPSQPSESIPQPELFQPSEQTSPLSPSTPSRVNKKVERIRMELLFTPPSSRDTKGTPPDGKVFPSRRKSCQSDA
jgi:hypothetical protein